MKTIPIRWRLTLWYSCVLAAVLVAFGGVVYFLMRYQLMDRVDNGLHEELADVRSEVTRAPSRAEMLGWLERRFGRHEGFDFQVTDAAGARVFANARMADRSLPIPKDRGQKPGFQTVPLQDVGRFRIVTQEIKGPDATLTLQVARSLTAFDHELRELLGILLLTGPLALVLAAAGGYWLARRALAPVERMRVTAEEINAERLSRRLAVGNSDEIGRLGKTLNDMLDRLEGMFREMQRFTADASHELRTPLAVIRSEAELALGKSLSDSEKQEFLGSILEECHRLTWITDQLLTLCREDAGISQHPREPVDLSQLVRGVTDTMRLLAEGKGQKLTAALNGPVIVQGDPIRLRHVIYNLIDNAIKYTPTDGQVTVSVSAKEQTARLIVEDTGIGIPDEHLPRVFDRFYRVDKSRNRGEGGAGLGLSIVRSIVSAHGGSVTISSRTEAGTRFTIELPQSSNISSA